MPSNATESRVRVIRGVFALALLLATFALTAAPAFAERTYESQITEAGGAPFTNPWGLAVDGFDNLWVADVYPGGHVDKFNSSSVFEAESTGTPWSGNYIEGIAFSNASNHLYVADSDFDDVWGLNPDASYAGIDLKESPAAEWGHGCCYLKVGADNSAGSTGGDLYVSSNGSVYRIKAGGAAASFSASGTEPYISGNRLTGTAEGPFGGGQTGIVDLATDSEGNLYVVDQSQGRVDEFEPSGVFLRSFSEAGGEPLGSVSAVAVDPTSGNVLIASSSKHVVDEFSSSGVFLEPSIAGTPTGPGEELVPFGNPRGLAVNSAGELYVSDGSSRVVDVFGAGGPPVISPKLTYTQPSNLTRTSVTLGGEADPNGGSEITECVFQYGLTASYDKTKECSPPTPYPDSEPTAVSAELSGLAAHAVYHYRLVLKNADGKKKNGSDQTFETLPMAPVILTLPIGPITTTTADVGGRVEPNNSPTTYYVEYGETEAYGLSQPTTQDAPVGSDLSSHFVSQQLTGLQPNTTYHYRIVATNQAGPNQGADHSFTTLASPAPVSCPNELARQQTGAASLLDCRAYELVSAARAGYEVESSVIPGQTPFGAYPQADDPPRVLYAVHGGGIPGAGHPTNRGPDPYVATRGEDGWSTEYVGIPADDPSASAPFSSPLAEANGTLDAFAFAGSGICSPCFGTGIGTGIPVHTPDGSLVQGMAGSLDPGPFAEPDGYIAKYFSADGTHFVFGSKSRFEPDANEGELAIYDRNLDTDVTHVVSKTPGGATMTGAEVAELDISQDGSRIIVAQKLATDADGNVYWHPYMDIGDSSHTVDLLPPGATHGVLFDGMTTDGSKVFFTTADRLLSAEDTDSSPDLYEAEVAQNGTLTLRLISTGSSDSCDPVANEDGAHWNTVGPEENCGAVAIAGAGGLGTADGTVYFLSPELLDGPSAGTENQPNLYLARPGSAPHFIATLDPNDPAVLDALRTAGARRYGDFQVAPSGNAAAFVSAAPLTGYDNAGHSEVYRYDASSDTLACASCSPLTPQAVGDSSLAPNGLSVTDDGRVFFTSPEPLVAADLDGRRDVYEFSHGAVQLISTGISPFDSGLLGVSADGTDVYFFTSDTLVPQDENGQLMKIYDARSGGGFFFVPPRAPCAASDECHGPGSASPGPPNIKTAGASPGNVAPEPAQCKQGRVRKHGRCVKPPHRPKHHKKQTARHQHGGRK